MKQKNHYAVLGVSQADDEGTIRGAYRRLAKEYHPDLNPGDKAAEAKMSEISEAWGVLGHKGKRAEYDRELSKRAGQASAPVSAARPGRAMTQEDFYRMSQSFEDILSPDAIRDSASKSGTKANPEGAASLFDQAVNAKMRDRK